MRFGQNIHQYQIVQWAPFYVDYQLLKRQCKTARRRAVDQDDAVDLTDFRASLHQELSKARSFYRQKQSTLQQSVQTLDEHHRISFTSGLEVADLTATLVELRAFAKQLLWFWLINFDKILSSLSKFEKDLAVSETDLALRSNTINELCRLDSLSSKLNSQVDLNPSAQTASAPPKHPGEYISGSTSKGELVAIEQDDASNLELHVEKRRERSKTDGQSYEHHLFALLYLSLIAGSQSCTLVLISAIDPIPRFGLHVHQLIRRVGRTIGLQNQIAPIRNSNHNVIPQLKANVIVSRLARVIARLEPLRKTLPVQDHLGRTPLHYAVEYDLPDVCHEFLKQARKYEALNLLTVEDFEGQIPMDLAVFHGNFGILSILLDDWENRRQIARSNGPHLTPSELLPGRLLTNAIGLQCFLIFQRLNRSHIDIKYTDHQGNAALYLAVRSRKEQYLRELLHHRSDGRTFDLDARDAIYGRTPLILAAANGDYPLVQLLLQAGSDPTLSDNRGLKAKDHAAFRGWLPMARELDGLTIGSLQNHDQLHNSHRQRRSDLKLGLSANVAERTAPRTLANECEIFVNLGALDTYKPVLAVDLSPYVRPDPFNPQREADFVVEIRAINDDQSRYIIQLPILEDRANKPWRFVAKKAEDFRLAFTVYHSTTSAQKGNSPIGSAVALVSSLKQGFGVARESLIRNFTIPILHRVTLDFIGTVTFYCLTVTPHPHPSPSKTIQRELSLSLDSGLPIIGHRGMGQNDPGRRQLQLGENTVESFLSAKASGASYIEFDVQLTKDDVPIIYHDFLMSETGIDAPLHNLDLEQFMFVSKAQCAEGNLSSATNRSQAQEKAKELIERMKHTFEYKLNEHRGFDAYKGNIRGEYIQASFATLEDLFTKLPESIRFDVEIKYPMLFEAHDWGMETFAVEVNHLVDQVLERVYRLGRKRTIFFSSFSPEVCIVLSRKQDVYPVYFLTESGHIPSADARADSLREAILFARSWRLAGVISRSQPLVVSPQLIGRVQDAGLVCISWGELNDVPENAEKQAMAGLDAIITNSVKLIAQTLNQQ